MRVAVVMSRGSDGHAPSSLVGEGRGRGRPRATAFRRSSNQAAIPSYHQARCVGLPPTLILPHKGGGNRQCLWLRERLL